MLTLDDAMFPCDRSEPIDEPDRAMRLARDQLLHRHGLSEQEVSTALSTMCASGADYADLYFQFSRSERWDLQEGIVKAASSSIDQGVGARTVSGERSGFSFTQSLSSQSLARVAATSAEILRSRGAPQASLPLQLAHRPVKCLYALTDPCRQTDAAAKVRLLARLEELAKSFDPRIVQVNARLTGDYDVILVARSDGLIAADVRPLVRVAIEVIAAQGGRQEFGTAGGGGRYGYEYFTDEVLCKYARSASQMALTGLEAQPAPAGIMSVVLGPGVPGVLLHEAVGHGLEGDFNRIGASAFAGLVGQRVAAPGVTVIDDGSLPNRRGSLSVDDEGTTTNATTLIEDGILVGYMQDSMNARLMGVPVTGNARRASFASVPMPRMTNTYMASGTRDPREIVESVRKGIYVANLSGGQVDITSGQFSMAATSAWLIEDGRLTAPVKGATLIGSGPEVLKRISLIGNDSSLDEGIGVCGKSGQSIPVGLGQPTLLIDGMTVGGTR